MVSWSVRRLSGHDVDAEDDKRDNEEKDSAENRSRYFICI
jgi:hypothetical protein